MWQSSGVTCTFFLIDYLYDLTDGAAENLFNFNMKREASLVSGGDADSVLAEALPPQLVGVEIRSG